MALKFPKEWRIRPPKSSSRDIENMPDRAVQDFLGLIRKTAYQGNLKHFFEHYKGYFCLSNGNPHVSSSNSSWAQTDLESEMRTAAENAPAFIEAFYNASEALRNRLDDLFAPDVSMINEILRNNDVGYIIDLPELKLLDEDVVIITVPEEPLSLESKGKDILQESLKRSDDLLSEGRGREAVQEILWLLETITTAFRGLETETKTIEGKYFNQIVKELKKAYSGTTLERVLEWISTMHGYLSSPTGGGVRHGLDLFDGLVLSINDERLFCNLIRSYLSFLIAEHERLMCSGDI